MTKAEQSLSRLLHHVADRSDDLLDMGLVLDAGRAFLERHAFDGRAALHAQRLHRGIDALGDGLGGIGIDDEDAIGVGHGRKHGP